VVAALYKKGDLLNCWTSSSDISGYHADFHEGHGTIGAWQGMLCESALSKPQQTFGEATSCHDSNTGVNKLSPCARACVCT
jgi:hypothetical protein